MKIINGRLSGIDDDFDAERERLKLHQLHAHDYAHSIYGKIERYLISQQALHLGKHVSGSTLKCIEGTFY